MQDDFDAAAAAEENEDTVLNEAEAPQESEEDIRLQKDLDKQVDKFRKLWLMLDSPNENERQVAFGRLHVTMARINEIHMELTGEAGSLKFSELLEKIENGGGGASDEDFEQMQLVLAQYEEVNEALKMAEDMLSREVRMLRFLLETRGYEKVHIENPGLIATQFLDNIENIQALCDNLGQFFDITPDQANEAYTKRLGQVFNTRFDQMDNKLHGFSRSLTEWLIKRQGLPGSIEDLMEVQCITRGQEAMLREEQALIKKLEGVEDLTKGLSDVLKCLMHQTYSDQHMKDMLDNLEFMERRLIKMADLEAELKEREGDISTLDEKLKLASEEIGRQKEAVAILNETISQLRATQRINAPLDDPDLADLDLSDPKDLRRSCEALVTVAKDGPPESQMKKDDLRRENALLREKVALLKGGKKSDRYDIVDRQVLANLVQSNEELEIALNAHRQKLETVLEGAQSWEEKYKADLAAAHLDHRAWAEQLKAEHEAALEKAVKEAVDEKTAEITKLQTEHANLVREVKNFDKERVAYRRDIAKKARDGGFSRSIVAGTFGLAMGVGGYAYIDETKPEAPTDSQIVQQEENAQTGQAVTPEDQAIAAPPLRNTPRP